MTGLSTKTRRLVKDRDRGRCLRCGARAEQIHHRRPRGRGGSSLAAANQPDNLVSLCSRCHEHIERNRLEAYASGWLLKHTVQSPAEVPLKDLAGSRFYLTEDGDRDQLPERVGLP